MESTEALRALAESPAIVPPVMHKEKFAELVGVSLGIVDGWCDRGYVPTVRVGKYSLVNLALLNVQCLKGISFD